MAENRGKQFEAQVKEDFEKVEGVSIDRLLDPQAGFSGIANICDFIVYRYPMQVYLECKSHHGTSIPFTAITDTQWAGLLRKSKINGVEAGVLVWFIDKDLTVYIPIQALENARLNGYKSIRALALDEEFGDDYIVVEGKKRRVLFTYNMENLLLKLRLK